MLKFIDEKNKEIEFEGGEKNFLSLIFCRIFSMKKKIKTREEQIEEVPLEFKKDLSNFQLTIDKIDKTIQEYITLLKLTKIEYQKMFNKNKSLK